MAADKWYRDGLRFSCTQCGNCCSGPPGCVWVTKKEIGRIAEFLGREDGKLQRSELRRIGLRYSLTEKPGGDCVYLVRKGDKTECSIHSVRPLQCRTWPFWTQNLGSIDKWNEAHRTCPGMNRGPHHTLVQIETIRKQREW